MYAYPVLCIRTAPILDANDSHLRLCLTSAKSIAVSVFLGFLSVLSGQGLSIPYPLFYPLCSLIYPLSYPLR